jgi:predicted Fe-S protein YdhL (DUF1289 family)
MTTVKTPCIGICSTTSLGDAICRGCKRYSFEVISWNGYNNSAKKAVLKRIEKLNCQIIENKLKIFSVLKLKAGLERHQIPFDQSLSPYCWLHNLLKKNHQNIEKAEEYGVYVLPEYAELSLAELSELIEQEILVLCEAHFARYFEGSKVGQLI